MPTHLSPRRLRIVVVSPEIVARIRHEFATTGLDVRIDGLPTVDVLVAPRTGAPPAALSSALNSLAGPPASRREPATARYRFALVPDEAAPAPRDRAPAVLSPREAEVMDRISRGMSNADVAADLHVRPKTVKNHVNHIFAKLGASGRVDAVLIWQRLATGG